MSDPEALSLPPPPELPSDRCQLRKRIATRAIVLLWHLGKLALCLYCMFVVAITMDIAIPIGALCIVACLSPAPEFLTGRPCGL